MIGVDEINQALHELWDRTFQDEPSGPLVLGPVLQAQPEPGCVVFVGLNPSFSESGWNALLRKRALPGETEPAKLDVRDFFRWRPHQPPDPGVSHQLEQLARDD